MTVRGARIMSFWEGGNGSQGPEDIKFYLFKQPLHKFIELLTGK